MWTEEIKSRVTPKVKNGRKEKKQTRCAGPTRKKSGVTPGAKNVRKKQNGGLRLRRRPAAEIVGISTRKQLERHAGGEELPQKEIVKVRSGEKNKFESRA